MADLTPQVRSEIFGMMLPGKSPVAIPANVDFSTDLSNFLDFGFAIDQGWVDFISGVYIFNPTNEIITIEVLGGTYQKLNFPAKSGGYVPLLFSNPPKVILTVANTAADLVRCLFYNVPMLPYIYSITASAGSTVDIVAIGGDPVTGPNLPVDVETLGGINISGTELPVAVVDPGITFTDYSLVLAGGDETPVAAGDALRYLSIQNPTGNNPVAVNIAGADSTVSGFTIDGGGSMTLESGLTNAVHVSGTNGETLIIFGGV